MNKQDLTTYSISCHANNSQCKHINDCIHQHVAKLRNQDAINNKIELTVSPSYLAHVQKEGECEYYNSKEELLFAKGMTHIFDKVPMAIYPQIRKAVISVFESKRVFFYYRNGERLLHPTQQAEIVNIFNNYKIAPSTFDEYIKSIDWDKA